MAEHGIFPPASLQSNDSLRVFSLTLTTAHKRDQFLPSWQCEEMEFFIAEQGEDGKYEGRSQKKPWAKQNQAVLRQKTASSSAKTQLSCPMAAAQILWVLCGEQRTAVFFVFCFFVFSGIRSEALMSSCQFSTSEYGTYLGPFSEDSFRFSTWKCWKWCHPFCHATAPKSVNLGHQPRVQSLTDAQYANRRQSRMTRTQSYFSLDGACSQDLQAHNMSGFQTSVKSTGQLWASMT